MTDQHTFLRHVLEEPDDVTVRLIYADWLDENGEPERAAFVRAQLAMPFVGQVAVAPAHGGWTGWDDPGGAERRLNLDADAIRAGVRGALGRHPDRQRCDHWTVRRGFVEDVALSLAAFVDHAAELFAVHPIVVVELTDRVAADRWAEEYWPTTIFRWTARWPLTGPADLPPALFDRLTGGEFEPEGRDRPESRVYPSTHAAARDLSGACVAYGREAANLPPLWAPEPR